MTNIDDGEVHFIGGNPINVEGEKPDAVYIETPKKDKLIWEVKESACEALDTTRLASIVNLWEIMYDLKNLHDSSDDSPGRVGKIMELEGNILAYKQFLTKDKVYRLYKNGSENFVVNNLHELECFLSPELGFDMIKWGYAHLVMPKLKKFGLSFDSSFVDNLIESDRCSVIADYIEYAEPPQQAEFVDRIIKEWYAYKIWYKLWKVKGLNIEKTVELMFEKEVEPKKIRRRLTIYSAHMEKNSNWD